MDKVCVVTVVYNRAKELEETIQNVIEQTYDNIEYIVVDGASKDGTQEVIHKYESHISKWISEPDKGIYDAMNKAILLAEGDWVIFLNAGDFFYDKDVLKNVFQGKNHENADFLYGDAVYILKGYNIHVPAKPLASFWRKQPFTHQALFTRRTIAEKSLFDLSFKICADYNFTYAHYSKGFNFKYIPTIIACQDSTEGASKSDYVYTYKEAMKVRKTYSSPLKYLLMKTNLIRMTLVRSILPEWIVKWVKTMRYERK